MNPIRQATIQAIKESNLSVRDKIKLRLALVFNGNEIDDIVQDTLESCSLPLPSPTTQGTFGGPDWTTILKFFIENILPLLLQFIK